MKVSAETLDRFASHFEDRYNVDVSIRQDGVFKVTHKGTLYAAILSGASHEQYTFMEPNEAWIINGDISDTFASICFYKGLSLYATLLALEGI